MNSLELDGRVRLAVYRHFVRRGLAPAVRDLSDELGASAAAIAASLERLAAAHVLVLDPVTRRLWMAMPFSAVPTAFRVRTSGGEWWANCVWDALGISAMLQAPAEIISGVPTAVTRRRFGRPGARSRPDPASCTSPCPPPIVSLSTAWALAQEWYWDRLEPAWRRRTATEAQALFTDLGLTDPFWRVAAPALPPGP